MELQLISDLVILIVIVAGLIWIYFNSHRRRRMLQEWAISQDLTFDHHKDRSIDQMYPTFTCLNEGRSRYAYNHMRGTWQGLNFHAFDYHYVTGYGKHRKTYTFTAVVIESPIPLKDLFIRREKFGDRVAEFFGADDIDFESIEFSNEFYVKASDKRWAFDVLHPRTIEFILSRPFFNLQFDSECVIAYNEWLMSPTDIQNAADLIHGILDRMPGYLTKGEPELKKPTRGRLRL